MIRPVRLVGPLLLAVLAAGAMVSGQGHCIRAYGTPACNTDPVPPVFDHTAWRTTKLDHIAFRVADAQKEAAFYAALMGWRVRAAEPGRVVMDIGDWGTAIFRQAPDSAHAVVERLGFVIEPWSTATVDRELRKRGMNPAADRDASGFESFHVKDPDGFELQISNRPRERANPATQAELSAPPPFKATNWRTVWLDHLSYNVSDYKRSASFLANLLGWGPTYDEGSQNELMIGDVGDAIVRGGNPLSPDFGTTSNPRAGQIDHISFGIAPWNTDAVKSALESRRLPVRVDTSDGAEIHVAQYKSYHTVTPNGFDLQISASTHDTRLSLALAVNPRRPGVR